MQSGRANNVYGSGVRNVSWNIFSRDIKMYNHLSVFSYIAAYYECCRSGCHHFFLAQTQSNLKVDVGNKSNKLEGIQSPNLCSNEFSFAAIAGDVMMSKNFWIAVMKRLMVRLCVK